MSDNLQILISALLNKNTQQKLQGELDIISKNLNVTLNVKSGSKTIKKESESLNNIYGKQLGIKKAISDEYGRQINLSQKRTAIESKVTADKNKQLAIQGQQLLQLNKMLTDNKFVFSADTAKLTEMQGKYREITKYVEHYNKVLSMGGKITQGQIAPLNQKIQLLNQVVQKEQERVYWAERIPKLYAQASAENEKYNQRKMNALHQQANLENKLRDKQRSEMDSSIQKTIVDRKKEQLNLELKQSQAINKNVRQEIKKTAELEKQLALYKQRMLGDDRVKGEIDIFAEKNAGRFDKDALSKIRDDVENLTVTTPNLNNEIAKTGTQFSLLKRAATDAGSVLIRTFENAFKFLRFYLVGGVLVKFISSIRDGVNGLYEIDEQLTQLRKVSGENLDVMREYAHIANDIAIRMGASTTAVIEQTVAWSRLGYTIQESAKLAEESIMLSVVGNMDIDRATKSLISTMKSYRIETENVRVITDAVNKVGNEFAISQEDIANILERSSSAMREAGNSMNELIALGVGAQEIVQSSEKVGTALRTVSIFYQKCGLL